VMTRRIDHVGVVVSNLEAALDLYVNRLGFERSASVEKAGEFKSVMVSLGDITLELIEPVDPLGGLQKFLEEKGEGLHHLSFEVEDIRKEMRSLGSKGVRFISERPEQVEDTLVCFAHPTSTGHVLIELLQKTDKRPDKGTGSGA
jgi:methylmalonyl-CoA/ethylmalonyl-CoA epimerase